MGHRGRKTLVFLENLRGGLFVSSPGGTMHSIVRDMRLALRSFAKSPGFVAVACLTLAIGIGANTAIFSVVYGVLLRPLAFAAPDRLVSLWEYAPDDSGAMHRWRVTAGNYADWEREATAFEGMALFGSAGLNWTGDGDPEQLLGARVTANYFAVLGIEPLLGRTFLPEENKPGKDRVIVLGHGLWQRRFGGARDVVGRTITLDGTPYEIVGVMPKAVYPTSPQATGRVPFLAVYQQMWVPMALSEAWKQNRNSHVFGVVARLGAGRTLEEARAQMDTIARGLEAAHPREDEGVRAVVVPYMDEVVGGVRPALLVLLGAVGLVLLIACANIATLLLSRAAGRLKEVAVRSALGAGRGALVRQFLSESAVLGALGGGLGLVVARLMIDLLTRLSPQAVPRLSDVALSYPVLGFALALSLATGVLFGLAPALHLSRPDLHQRLRVRGSRLGMRRALVVAEISLAVVLVVGASLLLQSLIRLRNVDPGFRADNVLIAELTLPPAKYKDYRGIARFHRELLERLDRVSGVRSSAVAYDHPLESNWIDSFRIVGEPGQDESLGAAFRIVSPDYFRTLGIDVREGRPFDELDDADHPGAVIVNQAFVHRYLPDEHPLGKRLSTSTPSAVWGESIPKVFEVVGVVEDVHFLGPAEPAEPAYYVPAAQFPVQEMKVALRTDGDPAAFASQVREAVWALDPDLPVSSITTMERLLSESLAQPRFNASVLGFFGITALALAALGIYGLVASTVSQRTSEIGLRMALGARATNVAWMFVSQGMRLTFFGIVVGVVVALLSGRFLASLLFGVAAADPATFFVVASFLATVAVLASYLPARRAARINPLEALRNESS
jgi:putative ABC transport system permease protein